MNVILANSYLQEAYITGKRVSELELSNSLVREFVKAINQIACANSTEDLINLKLKGAIDVKGLDGNAYSISIIGYRLNQDFPNGKELQLIYKVSSSELDPFARINDNKVTDIDGRDLASPLPFHPSEYLNEEIEARHIGKSELSHKLRLSPLDLSYLLRGRTTITPTIAKQLELVFNLSAKYWLELQSAYTATKNSKKELA